MDQVKLGIVGCGNISDAYLKGGARSQLVAVKAVHRPGARGGGRGAAEEYGVAAVPLERDARRPRDRDRHQPDRARWPMPRSATGRSRPASTSIPRSRSPRPSPRAASWRRPPRAKGVRLGSRPGHLLRCRPSGGALRHRRGPDRPRRRRGGLLRRAGHGELAPQPVLLLQARRRPGARHRLLPDHPAGQLPGPGRERGGARLARPETRTVTSEPRRGEVIEVEVPTTVNGVLEFANGANVALTVSWDIWKHARLPIELYGTEGSLLNPDPNFFGGPTRVSARNGDWQDLPLAAHPFGTPNAQEQRRKRGRRLPHGRRVRHGLRHRRKAARIAPTATWPCMCWRSWRPWSAARSRAAAAYRDHLRAAGPGAAGRGRGGLPDAELTLRVRARGRGPS